MRSLWLIPLALASCAGEAATSSSTEARFPWERVTWFPDGDLSGARENESELREVAALSPSLFGAVWRVAEGQGRVDLPVDVRPDSNSLRLTGEGARLAAISVDLTASDLHRAHITLDIPEGDTELFRLSFETDGRTRAYTDVQAVTGTEGTEDLDLDLAQVRPLQGSIDRLVCETLGKAEWCEVHSIRFFSESPLAHVPTASSGPGLLYVGDDGRMGVALDAAHPAAAEIAAPRGASLEFSYRVLSSEEARGATLVVHGIAGAEELRLPLGDDGVSTSEWRTVRRSLSQPLTEPLRFRIDGSSADVVAYVADAGVDTTALAPESGPSPTTVLLVTSDTHRGQLLGTTAGGLVRTPSLDALGARGLVFTDASATSNSTNPSHVALMTGLHPRDTHVVTNRDPLARQARTLAEHFAGAGWRTAASFSAFHLGDDTSGLGQGFDRYDGPGAPTGMNFDAFAGAASAVRAGKDTVARALAQLENASGAPLFLWVHVFDAHAPYLPDDGFDGRYRPIGVDPETDGPGMPVPASKVPRFLKRVKDPEEPWNQYRALVDQVDAILTPLVTAPRVASGITAFTSDHGECFGEHGIWWNHAGVYPATTHVPLVVAWPGAVPARVDAPVEQRQLGRTLLNLAGLEDNELVGRDLRYAAEDGPAAPRFSLGYYARSASMDDGRWYLVIHLVEEANDEGTHTWAPGEVELFDRESDPACATNLIEAELPRARRMRTRLLEWLASGDEEGLKGEYHVKAAIDRALSELGYAGTGGASGRWYDAERGDAFLDTYGDE